MVKPNKGDTGFAKMDDTAREQNRKGGDMNRDARGDEANRFESGLTDDEGDDAKKY